MEKLNREIFVNCLGNKSEMKALALAIYVKNHFSASALHANNLSIMAKKLGISPTTLSRLLKILEQKKLISKYKDSKGKRIIVFKSLNSKKARWKMDISKLKNLGIDNTLKALYALVIVDTQKQIDHVTQQTTSTTERLNNNKRVQMRTYRKLSALGVIWEIENEDGEKTGKFDTNVKDRGISYDYLMRKMNLSRATVSKVIKLGDKIRLFRKINRVQSVFVGKDAANCCKYSQNAVSYKGERVLFVEANLYKLVG